MTPDLAEKFRRADRFDLGDEVVLVPGEEILGSSLRDAVRQARAWLDGRSEDDPEDSDRRRGGEEER